MPSNHVFSTLVLVSCLLMPAGIARSQTTWYVDDDAPNDPGPGDPTVSDPDEDGSADHPFDAIQEGIDAAWPGHEVVALDGTYTGLGNRDLDFDGKAITVRSQSDNPDDCVIDCEASSSDPHKGFYFQSHEHASSVLRGLTITGAWGGFGGAISCDAWSSPTITNCTFRDNAAEWGAAIECNDSSNPTISHCTMTGNIADYGGAIDCYESNPVITNCEMTGNMASYGGGLCCWYDSRPAVENCTIAGNNAWGGVYVYCDPGYGPQIVNSILWGNISYEIYVYDGDPVVTYSDVQSGWLGTGNINEDPLFVSGQIGSHYLSQTAAGQAGQSPCVDAGSNTAANLGLDALTTRTDQVTDSGTVDMGYHYPLADAEPVPGDCDGNGDVDFDDLDGFIAALLGDIGQCPEGRADMNGDDAVNGLDVQGFVIALLEP
ncbi:MAG: right-handed parallel beta-helix repeat-containing protein [Phycisphaerae bacterium]|nr:right-handed parallel beta-helix repeat-containing protein [Phycisphaerae bacterium]